MPIFDETNDDDIAPIHDEVIDTTSRHYIPTVKDAIDELESDKLPKDVSLKEALPIAVSPIDKILPRETQELLRYFTRAEKRKRTNLSTAKTE